jgi:hypothetical protein
MVVHPVCFALMSEQASVGRKAKVLTVRSRACIPAGVGPQVGVQVFAVGYGLAIVRGGASALPTRKYIFAWWVGDCSWIRPSWGSGRIHLGLVSCRREDHSGP